MKNAVCLFCLFLLHTATAQVYKHRSFATADGLSSTTIYHALQDRNFESDFEKIFQKNKKSTDGR